MLKWIMQSMLLLLLVYGPLTPTLSAQGEKRAALIIGNSAYQYIIPLRNPYNDAIRLSEVFERLGFKVLCGTNMTKFEMDEYILLFSRQLQSAEMATFFYAGHGIQIDSKNFLIPTDFDPSNKENPSSQLISLNKILYEMEKNEQTSIIFLDACRDNPLNEQIALEVAKGRSMDPDEGRGIKKVHRGLAKVEGKAGTLIVYATQPGNIALDGTGLNSPFTAALLEYLEEPGMEIRDILTNVRMEVMKKTEEKQIPWDHSSLIEKVYFKKKKRSFAPPP